MSIAGTPPSHASLNLTGLTRVFTVRLLNTGLLGEVGTFGAGETAPLGQEQVDRAASKLLELYRSMPQDERAVIEALLAQAAAFAEATFPAD